MAEKILRHDIDVNDYQLVIDEGYNSEISSLEDLISELEKSIVEDDENIIFGIDFSKIKKSKIKSLIEELNEILQNKSAEIQIF